MYLVFTENLLGSPSPLSLFDDVGGGAGSKSENRGSLSFRVLPPPPPMELVVEEEAKLT